MVPRGLLGLAAEMDVHLGLQHALSQRFHQVPDQPVASAITQKRP